MGSGETSSSTSAGGNHSPPSPYAVQRPLTPPPRRPRTPATPAPSSPRVSTVPLPDISPGPVPITVTGPSTPIAGVFGMMGLNLEPGSWSIGSPVHNLSGLGLGTSTPGGTTTSMSMAVGASMGPPSPLGADGADYPFPNSLPASGTGTPTRSYHHQPQTISPAGLIALHNSFERYEREAVEHRWVATSTSTPAASTPVSPDGSPRRRNNRAVSLPLSGHPLLLPEEGLLDIPEDSNDTGNGDYIVSEPEEEPSISEDITPTRLRTGAHAPGAASPSPSPSNPSEEGLGNGTAEDAEEVSQSQSVSVRAVEDASPRRFSLALPPFALQVQPPRVLSLDDVRERHADGVLAHWPAVTRVAGHTVIHRAVPGRPEDVADVEVEDVSSVTPTPAENDSLALGNPFTSNAPTAEVASPTRSPLTSAPSSRRQSMVLGRRPSRAAPPAIFGADLAGPLVARIARSKAAGTQEAWWAWGAPAIRAAAWAVLDDVPPVESLTAANPHSHANTRVKTTTTTTTTETASTSTEAGVAALDLETRTIMETRTETTTTTEVITTSCACNDSPLSWGDGGGFTTRLGSFVFAPPFDEAEAAHLRAAAAAAAAALTVCDGMCGCADSVHEEDYDFVQEVEIDDITEDEVTPTEKTTRERGTPRSLPASLPPSLPPSGPTSPATHAAALPSRSRAGSNADEIAEATTGLLGLSLSSFRPSLRLSMQLPSLSQTDKGDKDKEKEGAGLGPALGGGDSRTISEPASSPPAVPISIPTEPMSPRSRRIGNVFGLSPRKRR